MCTQINDWKSERKYVTGCILHNENKFAGIFVTVLSWLSILGYCEHQPLLPYDLSFWTYPFIKMFKRLIMPVILLKNPCFFVFFVFCFLS